MNVKDEVFRQDMAYLASQSPWFSQMAERIQSRDKNHIEALAQIQSERDQYDELHLESIQMVSDMKTKLDKAIELLQYLMEAPGVSALMQSKIDFALYEIDENHSKKQY